MTEKEHFPLVILGGGIAGISAAYHSPGEHILFEKNAKVGGLAGSTAVKGYTFDFTGHLLHLRDPYAIELINILLGSNLQKHSRKASIILDKTEVPYPFQANLHGLPKEVINDCLYGMMEAVKKPQKPFDPKRTFADWVMDTFGQGMAKHFFYPYNRKLWTVTAQEMTCEWVGQFVPRPNMNEVIDGANGTQKKDFGYNTHFFYPKRGGIEALTKAFVGTGQVDALTSTTVRSISLKKNTVTVLRNGKLQSYTWSSLINTLPLPMFISMIEDVPETYARSAKMLKWNSVLNINLGLKYRDPDNDRHWIYFPDTKIPFYRVGFPMNFANTVAPKGCSSMYVEMAYHANELPRGQAEADAVFKATDALKEVGLLRSTNDLDVVNILHIPVAYVIYDKYRTEIVESLKSFLKQYNIQTIGRYGAWEYSFIERCIMQGKEAAEKALTETLR